MLHCIIERMKRHAIALLIHPYKNVLIKKDKMKSMLDVFAEKLIDIVAHYSNLRINLTLPGYMLQLLDPVLLSRLNEFQKSGCLEWLTPGQTEPFLSFSPLWLSNENIKFGLETFNQLLGNEPIGYVPAFSNWEPSSIKVLIDNRIQYTVLSKTLLPKNVRNYCGYWITEHTGYSMVIIPTYSLHFYNAPANIPGWIERVIESSPDKSSGQFIAIDYLFPLVPHKDRDPFIWLNAFAESLDALLVKHQMSLLHELPTLSPPLGLQSLPSSLTYKQENDEPVSQYSNYLYTFDSVGILQRKMMDIVDTIKDQWHYKDMLPLKKQLFSIQDINRYLPHDYSGFQHIRDRFWTFGQMIEIEREILKKGKVTGGQIRIADFLRNGTKSIVMSNKNLKVYIDHKNGGQIFELDYRERGANLFACHNSKPHIPPRIIVAGKSHVSFIDHFLDEDCKRSEFISNTAKKRGDFINGEFDYKIKKTTSSVKTILTRQGSININSKPYPLGIEKVFGLEKDKPGLSFVYQFLNHSLTTYAFKFAVELNISLPGVQSHQAEIICNKKSYKRLAWDRITINDVTEWRLLDRRIGVEIKFITQKPVTVWCYPVTVSLPYQGTTLVITKPVSLEQNSVWSLMGKISCKKIPIKGTINDVI